MKKEPRNPNRFVRRGIVAEYLQAKEIVENRLWKIVGNRLITFFDGEWLSESELREKLPILSRPNLFANPDNPNVLNNFAL